MHTTTRRPGRHLTPNEVEQIVARLRKGLTNSAIAAEVGVHKGTPARYRSALGIPAAPPPPRPRHTDSVEERFYSFTRLLDGGHMEWTGRRVKVGRTPVFSYNSRTLTARSVAFRIARGRDPQGYVTAECEFEGCVAPAHVADEPSRTQLRSQLASLMGRDLSLTECGRGHATAEHRRYYPDGAPYCGACYALTHNARRAAT
ncbi:helix-turn-helix domain-containing protein [Streptomyces sp. NPDC005389]|uniref:helix-turn-helix domain-containing protein n=1 Tax=Streptomyces sp. NPDC005389 TaxID=3157040 RepID=UPI0033B295B6